MVADSITSPANPRIKAFAALKKARTRAATGRFLIEGGREVARALAAGIAIETVLICEELLIGQPPALPDNIDVLRVSRLPMEKVSIRQNPAGIIAVATQFDIGLDHLELGPRPLVLIVERVEKPGNLGAMLRTADAVAADAVVVTDAVTDVFNPNVVRASQGAVFSVPIAVATTIETIEWGRTAALQMVGGYPDADADLWDIDLTGPTAIVIGAEDAGLSDPWTKSTIGVRIPMAGEADSLNASVSAALMLYEAVRQRRAYEPRVPR